MRVRRPSTSQTANYGNPSRPSLVVFPPEIWYPTFSLCQPSEITLALESLSSTLVHASCRRPCSCSLYQKNRRRTRHKRKVCGRGPESGMALPPQLQISLRCYFSIPIGKENASPTARTSQHKYARASDSPCSWLSSRKVLDQHQPTLLAHEHW